MTLGRPTPKGKEKGRWRMVKPMLGLAGGVLFKANCQGVPIITQPRKERKIREHNTDMTETRAARVEQNTRHKAEPSTLYQEWLFPLIGFKAFPAMPHLGFTFCHLASFSLGFPEPEGHLYLNPPGPVLL